MDVKATFTRDDRKSTLESCEFGEDAAQKAYKEALSISSALPADVAAIVSKQQTQLRKAHDNIKQQRDLHVH